MNTQISDVYGNVDILNNKAALIDSVNNFTERNIFSGTVELNFTPVLNKQAVNKQYVDDKVSVDLSNLIAVAPAALDTLREFSEAIEGDTEM